MVKNGRQRPTAVALFDEIEKMVAGSQGGDLSGTSQAMVEQFLQWVELRKVQGLLLVGIPGAGKTRTAECFAGEIGGPLMRCSMSSVKGSLVGQSEQNMRALLKAIDSVADVDNGGCVQMMATCNSVDALSPELMGRFKQGIMFWTYPDSETELPSLWEYFMAKYELKGPIPPVRNWVGREVESCCYRAWQFGCTLAEAAKTVVPISVSNAAKMEALMQSASGRYLSAATFGPYEYRASKGAFFEPQENKRKVTL